MKKIFDLFDFFGIHDYYESNNLLISSCPIHEGDNITAFNINIDEYNEEHYGKWFCNTKGCHNDKPSPGVKPEQSCAAVGLQDSVTGAVKVHMRTDVASITDSQAV